MSDQERRDRFFDHLTRVGREQERAAVSFHRSDFLTPEEWRVLIEHNRKRGRPGPADPGYHRKGVDRA
jgi:hypothetical protein